MKWYSVTAVPALYTRFSLRKTMKQTKLYFCYRWDENEKKISTKVSEISTAPKLVPN